MEKGENLMLKKIIVCSLSIILIFTLGTSTVLAAEDGYIPSDSMLEYVSDLSSYNVRYVVHNSEGQDVTDNFKVATANMTATEICFYMHENVLMISKQYMDGVQVATVCGNETFRQWIGGYVWDRNHMFKAEIIFQIVCTVNWDSDYGISSGSFEIDSSTFRCTNFYNATLVDENYSTRILNNRRTIRYSWDVVFGVNIVGSYNAIYYDYSDYFDWSC